MKFGKALMFTATSLKIIVLSRISPVHSFSMTMSSSIKSKLYDLPVSNNGARCRIILYKKEIPQQEVQIVSPMDVGGLKSPEYLAMNPEGKMPLLSIEGGMNIPESDTICRYLMSAYADRGPDFLPNDARSNVIARIHDMYITTIQGALYKAAPPFGVYGTRSDALEELQKQLGIIDGFVEDDRDGIYLCGKDVSLADASLFPTMIFMDVMFPKFGIENGIPMKLKTWFDQVREKDSVFAKVYEEVSDRSVQTP
jgi:glutathione S-transferase